MLIRKPNGTTVMSFCPHAQDPSIYWLNAQIMKSRSSLSALAMQAQGHKLWHQCLGHPLSDVLHQVPRHTTGGLAQLTISKEVPICKGCVQGKMARSLFLDSDSHATELFALIHSNLKTVPVTSYYKYKYVLTFLDDFTSHGWVTFLKDKASTYTAWLNFIARVKTQYKKEVHAMMCDMGGEFTFLKLTKKFKKPSIKVYHSIPHMPQQNGRAERFNWTIFEKANAMRHIACLPRSWWEFSVKYVICVYNRTPMHQIKHKTPFECIDKKNLTFCICEQWVVVPMSSYMKIYAELMTFIGYTDGVKGWKFM